MENKNKSYDTGWCGYLVAFLVCACCHQKWRRRPRRVRWWVSRPVSAEWRPRTPATRYPETIQTLHHWWLLKDLLSVHVILQNLFSFFKGMIYFPWFERKKNYWCIKDFVVKTWKINHKYALETIKSTRTYPEFG